MPQLKKLIPAYRSHKASSQAVVKLSGYGRYLGAYCSDESVRLPVSKQLRNHLRTKNWDAKAHGRSWLKCHRPPIAGLELQFENGVVNDARFLVGPIRPQPRAGTGRVAVSDTYIALDR
jgi:hypothetical protein